MCRQIEIYLCYLYVRIYSCVRHGRDNYYIGKNFGLIEVTPTQKATIAADTDKSADVEVGGWEVEISVRSLETGNNNSNSNSSGDSIHSKKNDIYSRNRGRHNASLGSKVLSHTLTLSAHSTHGSISASSSSGNKITSVEMTEFYLLPPALRAAVYVLIAFVLYVLYFLLRRRGGRRKNGTKKLE